MTMNKIKTETSYKGITFDLVRETKGIRMYFSKGMDYLLITNIEEEVLFEVRVECSINDVFLEEVSQ